MGYKMAGDIANRVLKNLIERCVLGVSALELCKIGDDMIVQETDKVYKKEKEIQKGIAVPTQANINNCICHYAPLSSVGANDFIVKENDIVKLDLGVHIDGYIAVVAHTVFMSEEKKGKAVDAMLTAAPKQPFDWSHLVLRTLKSQTLYQKFPSLMVVRQSRECYHTKWSRILSMAKRQLSKIQLKSNVKNTKTVNLPSMKSTLLICSSLLVMENHVIWISVQPFIRENQTKSINSK